MTEWLIDTSALARLGVTPEADVWAERIDRGLVRITTLTLLEVGFSAKSGSELRTAMRRAPLAAMPVEYLTPASESRAVEVQALLGDIGHHRGPSVPDLVVAATAELAGLTVLHVDKDFDVIADVTGQLTERLSLG